MKFRLYSTTSGWNSRHASIKEYLGIPVGTTTGYATCNQINNPESADYGKYAFPVKTTGRWKCDDQFPASDLVDYDPTWYPPTPFPPDED